MGNSTTAAAALIWARILLVLLTVAGWLVCRVDEHDALQGPPGVWTWAAGGTKGNGGLEVCSIATALRARSTAASIPLSCTRSLAASVRSQIRQQAAHSRQDKCSHPNRPQEVQAPLSETRPAFSTTGTLASEDIVDVFTREDRVMTVITFFSFKWWDGWKTSGQGRAEKTKEAYGYPLLAF